MKVTRAPYDDIDFSPPKDCQEEARRGLKWHEEGHSGDGLTPATVRWARRLARGEDITPDKARKMRAWLARHESDKEGQGFYPGENGFPSPGRVAWALWCGDPGVRWSNKLVRQMDSADENKGSANVLQSISVAKNLQTEQDNRIDLMIIEGHAMNKVYQRKLHVPKGYGDDDDEDMPHSDAMEDEDERLTYVIASAPTPDRYGDIVQPDWRLERFLKNPVVPFGHDYTKPPVGKVVALEIDHGGALVAAIEWDDTPENPLGQTVASQFRRGFMSAVSVGFSPGEVIERSSLPPDDPYYGESGSVYRSPELLELSAVSIPAHADALAIRDLSDVKTKHIIAVEEDDEQIIVTYAKRVVEEAPAQTNEEPGDEPDESKAMLQVFGTHELESFFGR